MTKMFSNSGICVCFYSPHLWSNRLSLDVFSQAEEYPYDYFFGPDGKEVRVFEVDKVGNPSTAHMLSIKEFEQGFMTKAQWNASKQWNANNGRNKT